MAQEETKEEKITVKGKVLIKAKAYKDIVLHASRFCNSKIPRNKWKEVYGFLVGTLQNENVVINEAVPMTHGGTTEVQFEEIHYIEAAELDGTLAESGQDFIIGWYHSHPGLDLFLSSVDIQNHMGFQGPNPKSIALVFDPTKLFEGHPGFEIFRINKIELTSAFYRVPWTILDLDEEFFARSLFELSEKSTARRPVIEEYGEEVTEIEPLPSATPPASSQIISIESQTPLETTTPTPSDKPSYAQQKLEKAFSEAGKGNYEEAIDLAISSGEEYEKNGQIGMATDAFQQIAGFLYEFWEKINKVRKDLFTRQKVPEEKDAKLMIDFAKLLHSTSKKIKFDRIGLETEIKDLDGNMIRVLDEKIQIANILYESSNVYSMLIQEISSKKDIKKQIDFLKNATSCLSTAIIFARAVEIQSDLAQRIFNFNKIMYQIHQNQGEIQEMYGEEQLLKINHLEAAKLFIGGANDLEESANSILDPSLQESLLAYSEKLVGRSFFSLADHQNYNQKKYCDANPYYIKAKEYFSKAAKTFALKKSQELTNIEVYLRLASQREEKTRQKCIQSKGKLIDVLKIKPTEPKIKVSKPEPLFFP
ncbi:MAG: hypothetical protein HWN67_06510 [Candidatus Helarchaeota archaeon]|nr:hypothetical protein [Candidatus Helarchaeota archaeon]